MSPIHAFRECVVREECLCARECVCEFFYFGFGIVPSVGFACTGAYRDVSRVCVCFLCVRIEGYSGPVIVSWHQLASLKGILPICVLVHPAVTAWLTTTRIITIQRTGMPTVSGGSIRLRLPNRHPLLNGQPYRARARPVIPA